MFIVKNKYYFLIESTKDINLRNIKRLNKYTIIYRNFKNTEKKEDLLKFRKNCKAKAIDFYVANNINLALNLGSDGIYLSSYNKSFRALSLKRQNFHIIGSAHTYKEINEKINQGCEKILLSKLFSVEYNKSAPHLGIIKFNNYLNLKKNLIPLGGINLNNLNNLNQIKCEGLALVSEIKKKPAKIINRLF